MKMKRFLALITAGIMVLGACMVVSAAPDSNSVSGNSISENSVSSDNGGSSDDSDNSGYDYSAYIAEIQASGVSAEINNAAQEAGLSVVEYISNSIIEVPGLKDVTPVGQGGKIVVDGKATNQTFSLRKPLSTHVTSAKSQAATLGGSVLNVINVQGSIASGKTASVNFYMPGVKAGQNIQIYRYNKGQWDSLNVTEVRADHVVVDMTATGVLAFIQVQ